MSNALDAAKEIHRFMVNFSRNAFPIADPQTERCLEAILLEHFPPRPEPEGLDKAVEMMFEYRQAGYTIEKAEWKDIIKALILKNCKIPDETREIKICDNCNEMIRSHPMVGVWCGCHDGAVYEAPKPPDNTDVGRAAMAIYSEPWPTDLAGLLDTIASIIHREVPILPDNCVAVDKKYMLAYKVCLEGMLELMAMSGRGLVGDEKEKTDFIKAALDALEERSGESERNN